MVTTVVSGECYDQFPDMAGFTKTVTVDGWGYVHCRYDEDVYTPTNGNWVTVPTDPPPVPTLPKNDSDEPHIVKG